MEPVSTLGGGARQPPPDPPQQVTLQVQPVDGARQPPPDPPQQDGFTEGGFTEDENAVYMMFQAVIRNERANARIHLHGSIPRLSGCIFHDYRAVDPGLLFPQGDQMQTTRGNLAKACIDAGFNGIEAQLLGLALWQAGKNFRAGLLQPHEVDGEDAG